MYALDWSPDGGFLLIGSDDNVIRLVDWLALEVVFKVTAHTDYVRALAFTAGSDATRI